MLFTGLKNKILKFNGEKVISLKTAGKSIFTAVFPLTSLGRSSNFLWFLLKAVFLAENVGYMLWMHKLYSLLLAKWARTIKLTCGISFGIGVCVELFLLGNEAWKWWKARGQTKGAVKNQNE
jgi:hypothetical protein